MLAVFEPGHEVVERRECFAKLQSPCNVSIELPTVKDILKVLLRPRNTSAHDSTNLTPSCVGHVEKCAELINPLFPPEQLPVVGCDGKREGVG